MIEQHLDLRSQQIEIAEIPRYQQGALGGNGERVEDVAPADVAVPAVYGAPPDSVPQFSWLAGGTDVVGNDAIVLVDPVHPGFDVFEDPAFVLVIAGEQVSMSYQAGGGQVAGRVAAEDDFVE